MNGLGSVGRLLVWGAAMAIMASCAGSEPERELRERIEAAAVAAEARDTGFFRDLIAASYADQRGNDRTSLLNLVRGQFLIHQRIEVISDIQAITVADGTAAHTVITAGLVGSAGPRLRFGELSAELYRIELEWIRDGGDWRVIGARWSGLGDPQ